MFVSHMIGPVAQTDYQDRLRDGTREHRLTQAHMQATSTHPGRRNAAGQRQKAFAMPTLTFVGRLRSAVVPVVVHGLALTVLLGLFAAFPVATAAEEAPSAQTIAIHDTRSGDGPCGFPVERTIEGDR